MKCHRYQLMYTPQLALYPYMQIAACAACEDTVTALPATLYPVLIHKNTVDTTDTAKGRRLVTIKAGDRPPLLTHTKQYIIQAIQHTVRR